MLRKGSQPLQLLADAVPSFTSAWWLMLCYLVAHAAWQLKSLSLKLNVDSFLVDLKKTPTYREESQAAPPPKCPPPILFSMGCLQDYNFLSLDSSTTKCWPCEGSNMWFTSTPSVLSNWFTLIQGYRTVEGNRLCHPCPALPAWPKLNLLALK